MLEDSCNGDNYDLVIKGLGILEERISEIEEKLSNVVINFASLILILQAHPEFDEFMKISLDILEKDHFNNCE